jgi:Flp pilus assembly protein TadD
MPQSENSSAIELDSRYAGAHQWYAFLLASQGKFDEALLEAHTAQKNDPASVSVRRSLGYCYLYARRFEQARYHLSRGIAMNPTAEESYRIQGLILTMLGEYAEAERVLREALELASPGSTYTKATLAYSLARGGNKTLALQVRDELLAKRKHDYVSPVELATVGIGLGEFEQAIDWCERAVDERRGWVMYLGVHPVVDPLRQHPRFQTLVRKMGLESIRLPH